MTTDATETTGAKELSYGESGDLPDSPVDSESGGRLLPVFLGPFVGIVCVLIAAFLGVKWASPDHYVVDYYPAEDGRLPIAVVRWPSQQVQLEPIILPRALAADTRWQGKQPKRAKLGPDTILPAGEVLEFDNSVPPGRYLLQLGAERIEVSPHANWSPGERAVKQAGEPEAGEKSAM